ncbi:MAG: radical SAM protein [Acidobacteria bacterium]|nr:radical SAM protein [Acidobacteriota bacterium]
MRRALKLALHYARHRFAPLHPFEVQAVLLNACNLRCTYCRCPDIETDLMTTAQWQALMPQLARVGALRIKFQGGEPTIRRDFGDIARAALDAGIETAVVTNGIAIARKASLLDHLREVVVSLDALAPHLHDQYRGPGSHAAAMTAIDVALARGRKVYINMVVHRDTLVDLEPMMAFCEQRGIGLNAQAVMFGKAYQDDTAKPLALPLEEEREMYRRLAAWKREGRVLMFSAQSYERTAAWPHPGQLAVRGDGPSTCMAGRYYIHIEPNGDVHPCGLHVASFIPKNAAADGLDAALRHVRQHDCADCSLAYLNERKLLFSLRPSALAAMLTRG